MKALIGGLTAVVVGLMLIGSAPAAPIPDDERRPSREGTASPGERSTESDTDSPRVVTGRVLRVKPVEVVRDEAAQRYDAVFDPHRNRRFVDIRHEAELRIDVFLDLAVGSHRRLLAQGRSFHARGLSENDDRRRIGSIPAGMRRTTDARAARCV